MQTHNIPVCACTLFPKPWQEHPTAIPEDRESRTCSARAEEEHAMFSSEGFGFRAFLGLGFRVLGFSCTLRVHVPKWLVPV